MTPTVLIAIMLILGLVLCAMLAGIVRQLRSKESRPKASKSKPLLVPHARAAPVPVAAPEPDKGEKLPRLVGRQRHLKALSEGGGDPSAMQALMESGAYASCERRLEQAFEVYSLGRVSLETYETMVRAEGERAKRLRAEFRAKELAGNTPAEELADFREEIETIEITVQWCLDWAEGIRGGASNRPKQEVAG